MVLSRTFSRRPVPGMLVEPINLMGINVVREIRFQITIGGIEIPNFTKWNKELSAYSPGSSATVEAPLGQLQQFISVPRRVPMDLMQFSNDKLPLPITIATTVRLRTPTLNRLQFSGASEFAGIIDTLTLNRSTGLYTIQARSYAQVLLNAKTNDAISSPSARRKTTSEAVRYLVDAYGQGLKAVIYPFKTPVDRIYAETGTLVSRNVPVWDLLQNFAEHDNADLFVDGDTLYYVPSPIETAPDITELKGVQPTYTYRHGQNILDLSLVHSPMFSHDLTVTVNSLQTKTGEVVTSTKGMSDLQVAALAAKLEMNQEDVERLNIASAAKLKDKRKNQMVTSGRITSARIGNKAKYTFTIPNATQEDCDRVGLRILQDISRKEFVGTLRVLGQPDFNARQIIKLDNSGSEAADQAYAIKSISTGYEAPQDGGESGGYTSELTIVNHRVQTTGVSL